MGIRFRKRVKIMPGVNLNISKSGISTTIGTKGASINIGKNGVYGNAGIPGTGIYAREKIIGNKRKCKQNSNKSIATNEEYTNTSYIANDCTHQYASQTKENSDQFSFGCLAIICGVIIGVFFGWAFGNMNLAFIISPILIALTFAQRYANLNKESDEWNSNEIEARKQAIPKNENINENEIEHIESDNISAYAYKKEAIYAELQKDYEKANYYWHKYLQDMFDSNCELDTEAVEKAIYCIRKSTDLMPELYLYYDLIRHYPNHPYITKWESERNELEKIINIKE